MNLRAEVTIDLDDKRRVWSQVDAENVPPEKCGDIAVEIAMSAADGAQRSFDHAIARDPRLGGERPKEPESMRGMQGG
jgi:hypothetical protein